MFKILTLNNISPLGLKHLPAENYQVGPEVKDPDAILLRSFNMHPLDMPPHLQAVGRAGAGVNNIPVDKPPRLGVPVLTRHRQRREAGRRHVAGGAASPGLGVRADFERHRHRISKAEAGKKNFAGWWAARWRSSASAPSGATSPTWASRSA